MPAYIEIPIGTRFGSWTTTSLKYKNRSVNQSEIDVVCDCGKTATRYAGQLTSGVSWRCRGCSSKTRVNQTKVSGKTYVTKAAYGSYVKCAVRRDYSFDLSIEEFESFIFSNCGYCGATPKNQIKDRRMYADETPLPKYNGIDRMNNSIGYTLDNSITCCRWCNEAKKAKSIEEFDTWMKGLSENYRSGNRSQTGKL